MHVKAAGAFPLIMDCSDYGTGLTVTNGRSDRLVGGRRASPPNH